MSFRQTAAFRILLPGLLLSNRNSGKAIRARCAGTALRSRRERASGSRRTSRSGRRAGCRIRGWPGGWRRRLLSRPRADSRCAGLCPPSFVRLVWSCGLLRLYHALAAPVGAAGPAGAGARGWLLWDHAQRHGDDERRAESEPGALGAHRSAVQLHDLRDDRQADAEARQLIGGRSALAVQLEDVRQEVGADSAAGIDHTQAGVGAVPIEADVDAAAVRRELDGGGGA